MIFNFVLLLLSMTAFTSASLHSTSGCPNSKPVEKFNLTILANGIWHEIARYPYDVETDETCVSYDMTLLDDGYMAERVDTPRYSTDFVLAVGKVVPNERASGRLNYIISSGGYPKKSIQLAVDVIFEDKNYFLCYSCEYDQLNDKKQEFAWVFSRELKLSTDEVQETRNIIDSIGYLDVDKFIWIDHSKC